MAIDFPNSPTNGQSYISGGKTWVYDGEKWVITTSSVAGPAGATGATGPAGATGPVGATGATGALSSTTTDLEVTGRLDVAELREVITDSSISIADVMTCNYNNGIIFYQATNPSANFIANITNAPTDNGKVITLTIFVEQGSTGYYPNVLEINNASQTLKWAGGTAPTPTSSSGKIDIFSFVCVRRSDTWTVFANASLNY